MGEVFVFEVEDIDADSWLAEVAVVAESRQAALKKIRDAGLHKKQIMEMAGRRAYTTLPSSVTPSVIEPRSCAVVFMTVGGRSGRQSRLGCH